MSSTAILRVVERTKWVKREKGIGEGSRVALEPSNNLFLSLYKIYKPKYKSLTLNEHVFFTKNKINKNYA